MTRSRQIPLTKLRPEKDGDTSHRTMPTSQQKYNKKNRIAIRDGSSGCFYCHKGGPMTLDHIIPKSQGGSWNVSNLRLACRECNLERGRKLVRLLKKGAK
mmetsp:Transcript_24390/g.69570  ORF Transcript_24390/g.69570 Transcript_24390/m.69570 type:complete len:100 (-) Transcript_24390:326-625(-)